MLNHRFYGDNYNVAFKYTQELGNAISEHWINSYFDKMANIDLKVHVLHSLFVERKKDIRQDITNTQDKLVKI